MDHLAEVLHVGQTFGIVLHISPVQTVAHVPVGRPGQDHPRHLVHVVDGIVHMGGSAPAYRDHGRTDLSGEKTSVHMGDESGPVDEGFDIRGHSCKIGGRADNDRISSEHLFNALVGHVVFDRAPAILILDAFAAGNASREIFTAHLDHLGFPSWTGPVIAPILLSILMIVLSLIIYAFNRGNSCQFKILRNDWFVLITGSILVFVVFIWDYCRFLIKNISSSELSFYKLSDLSLKYIPESFNWALFSVGFLVISAGIFSIYISGKVN